MLLRVETNDTLRTSLAGFIESWINSTVSLVMSASSFGHRDFIILTQVYSLKGIIALLFSEVAPASELDQFAYNALVSAVVLSVVLQYLIGYVDKGGTKTYNSGSLEFRATFVSLLLFRGAYVWIKFRDVPPNRAVYRRFRKDENGGFHHYGKYEPRFKPPREKDAVTGGVRKFEYLPLGGYDTHREAEVACQIAGYYYGKDDGKVKLEDGSFFDIPRMSEQERSLCGEQKRNFVRGKVKEVHKVFKEDVARRSRSSDGLGASPGDHIPHCADQTDVNCEADFLHILNELPEPDSEVDLNVDEVPDCSQQENIGVPTMQENLNEQLNLEDPELPRQFEFLTMMLRQAANTISSHLVASTEGNLELPQKYEYLMTVLQEVVKALQYCRVTSTKVSLQTAVAAEEATSSKSHITWPKQLSTDISEVDPEIDDIIERENRQWKGLELIPSENFTSLSVMQAAGSFMTNKYSEGYPGARYYGGTEFIDMAEILCKKRALAAFRLDPEKWGVNLQSFSGSPSNFQVYTALLKPHDPIMALDLPHDGHLSHGYQTDTKKISAVSILDESTGYIDYDTMEKNADLSRPKLIVAGASSYPRHYDYARMRKVCDKQNATLLADIGNISGLVAAGVVPSPFEFADVVTTTMHESLRGPRGAMIFYRKGLKEINKKGEQIFYDYEDKINAAVFPGLRGGPHNHTITGLAVALKQAATLEFKAYQEQVLSNGARFAKALMDRGHELVSGGTENHLVLVNLKPKGVDGSSVERVMELAHIAANKNTVPGDVSALVPGGICMGTPALTSRGFTEEDFEKVAEYFDRAVDIAVKVKKSTGTKLKDFRAAVDTDPEVRAEIRRLKVEVEDFAKQFPTMVLKLTSQ